MTGGSELLLLKQRLQRLWVFSPERLWLFSIRLSDRGHWMIAFWLKQLNSLVYRNSLSPGASVSPDVVLAHNSIGTVVSGNIVIGRGVKIFQNVTLTAGRPERSEAPTADARDGSSTATSQPPVPVRSRIVIEDHVRIGASSVIIAPRGRTLRVGRGARIGAGTVVTKDVPPGATVVGQAPRVILPDEAAGCSGAQRSEVGGSGSRGEA